MECTSEAIAQDAPQIRDLAIERIRDELKQLDGAIRFWSVGRGAPLKDSHVMHEQFCKERAVVEWILRMVEVGQ